MADPEASPRLRAILDNSRASVKDGFSHLGTVSINDSFDPAFGDWFEPHSRSLHIVQQAQLQVLAKPVASSTSSACGSSAMHSFAPGRSSSFESVPFKRPKSKSAKP